MYTRAAAGANTRTAEMAANGVVQCVHHGYTAAAGDKREVIAWLLGSPPSTVEAFSEKISEKTYSSLNKMTRKS